MKCQILFSKKSKKIISRCRLLKFLPSMQSVKKMVMFIGFLTMEETYWLKKTLKTGQRNPVKNYGNLNVFQAFVKCEKTRCYYKKI